MVIISGVPIVEFLRYPFLSGALHHAVIYICGGGIAGDGAQHSLGVGGGRER